MKDLFLTQGHLEAQPWQTPPLPSVETKVGRVERQRGEGGETCESWTAGGGKGEGRGEMVARLAEGLSPLRGAGRQGLS